jgi:hypothetical protein
MSTAKVKDLLAQLRNAAGAIKAQIHEIDDQIDALTEQRRALTDAPVSKADLAEFIRADILRRAENYQWRVDKWVKDGCYPMSFDDLERRHKSGNAQPLPYLDGNPLHGVLQQMEPAGIYHLFGDLLMDRFLAALDKHGYADDSVPVADRRRQIAEIDAKLRTLNAKRDELANDLINSGMTE